MSKVFHCRLITHDYLMFTTRGFENTTMNQYISNYALMYAINRHVSDVQRNASGNTPFYDKDLPNMTIYTTPAGHISSTTEIDSLMIRTPFQLDSFVPSVMQHITYNSIDSVTQLTNKEKVPENLPMVGKKARFVPLNQFEFFAIGGDPTGVIRLGKKNAVCRIVTKETKLKSADRGYHNPSHPINPADISGFKFSDLRNGMILKQTPPLVIRPEFNGEYYICTSGSEEYIVSKPNPELFRGISLP